MGQSVLQRPRPHPLGGPVQDDPQPAGSEGHSFRVGFALCIICRCSDASEVFLSGRETVPWQEFHVTVGMYVFWATRFRRMVYYSFVYKKNRLTFYFEKKMCGGVKHICRGGEKKQVRPRTHTRKASLTRTHCCESSRSRGASARATARALLSNGSSLLIPNRDPHDGANPPPSSCPARPRPRRPEGGRGCRRHTAPGG